MEKTTLSGNDYREKSVLQDNHFNLMRLFFATMVLYSHSYGLLAQTEPVILGRSFGNFAVHAFFALSGYFIAQSAIHSRGALDFFYRRALRILPVYMLTSLLIDPVIAALFGNFVTNPVPYIINGSVWTLYYEVLLYVICGVMAILCLLNEAVLGALTACALFLIILFYGNASEFYAVLAPMFFLFLEGAYLSTVEKKMHIQRYGIPAILVLLIVQFATGFFDALAGKMTWLYAPTFSPNFINYILYLISLPVALIWLGKYTPTVKIERVIQKNDISYGLYIYAWPIQQVVVYFLSVKHGVTNGLYVFVVSLVITAAVSILSCKLLEQPFMKLKKYSAVWQTKVQEFKGDMFK